MVDIAELGLAVKSDDFVVATDRMGKFEKQAGSSEMALGRLVKTAKQTAQALAAALAVRQIIRYADAWSDMQSKVGAAVKSMDAAPKLMRRMVDIANASYSPLEQTVEAYTRNVAVLRDLGRTAEDTADFTEALNHALVVTATKGEQAASVQNALSKAMAVGKLTGDGLETVLANGGRVAEALAKELGTTINGLRDMASSGKITSAVISGALIGSLEALREEAGAMPATVADGMQRIATGISYIVGVFDKLTGTSGALAGALVAVGDTLASVGGWLSDHADLVSAAFSHLVGVIISAGTAAAVYYVPMVWAAVASTWAWIGSLVTLRGALIATGVGALVVGAGILIGYFLRLVSAAGGFGEALTLLSDVGREVWARMGVYVALWGARLRVGWAEAKAGGIEMFAGIIESGVWFANRFIGTFRGAFNAVKVIWATLPAAIGGAVVGAVNATITAVEGMIKKVAGALDNLTAGIANSWVGEQLGLTGTSIAGSINLGRVAAMAGPAGPNQTAGAAFEAGYSADTIDSGSGSGGLRGKASALRGEASAYQEAATMLGKATEKPLTAWQKLLSVFQATPEGVEGVETAATTAASALDAMGNAGSGAADKAKKAVDSLKEATETFRSTLSSAFVGLVTGAQSVSSAISNVIGKLAEMAAEKAFSQLWSGGLGDLSGSFIKALGFADGGAFSMGRVIPFATGGVVSSPTTFPMSGGTTGLMGEAGPEAIMPLARTSSGKLGVQTAGGAGQVQQIRVTVEVLDDGNLRAVARDAAGQVMAEGLSAAAPAIVTQSVRATGKAMRSTKAFGGA